MVEILKEAILFFAVCFLIFFFVILFSYVLILSVLTKVVSSVSKDTLMQRTNNVSTLGATDFKM